MAGPLLLTDDQKPEIFVDLDRTLLDTNRFIRLLLGMVIEIPRIEDEVVRIEKEFIAGEGNLRRYRVWEHFADLGVSQDEVLALEKPMQAQGGLLYSDAVPAMEYLARRYPVTKILTFGEWAFQAFKLRCLPELAGYEAEIVEEHKGRRLSLVNGPSVLLDDKNISGLPDSTTLLHLDRSAPAVVRNSDRHVTIPNLEIPTLEQIL